MSRYFNLFALNFVAKLSQFVLHHLVRYRAKEAATFTGRNNDLDLKFAELIAKGGTLFALLFFSLLDRSRPRGKDRKVCFIVQHRQALGQQEVASISIFNNYNIALFTEVCDILIKNNFHRNTPYTFLLYVIQVSVTPSKGRAKTTSRFNPGTKKIKITAMNTNRPAR